MATFLIFDGLSASTLGASFTEVVFSFPVTLTLAAAGLIFALLVGLIGGLFPAVRAARKPIIADLYGQRRAAGLIEPGIPVNVVLSLDSDEK